MVNLAARNALARIDEEAMPAELDVAARIDEEAMPAELDVAARIAALL